MVHQPLLHELCKTMVLISQTKISTISCHCLYKINVQIHNAEEPIHTVALLNWQTTQFLVYCMGKLVPN